MTRGEPRSDVESRRFESFVTVEGARLRRALIAMYGVDEGCDACAEALAWAWENWSRVVDMANPVGYLFRVGQTSARRQRRWHGPISLPSEIGFSDLHEMDGRLDEALVALDLPATGRCGPRARLRLLVRRGRADHDDVCRKRPKRPAPSDETTATKVGNTMKPTVEQRLHEYANTLDEAAARRVVEFPAPDDAPIASLGTAGTRNRGTGVRRVAAIVATIIVAAAAATIVATEHGHTATTDAPTSTTIRPRDDGLRALFTRTAATGIVIVARAGLVPVAAADQAAGCPVIPVPSTQTTNSDCAIGTAPGVEFDFSTGGRMFRATVLNRDIPHATGPDLEPMITLSDIRQILPNGQSVLQPAGRPPYLVILHAIKIAKVRVNPTRTTAAGLDEMTPVNGWAAFAAPASSDIPFDNTVQGLNPAGHVIETTQPWRCC